MCCISWWSLENDIHKTVVFVPCLELVLHVLEGTIGFPYKYKHKLWKSTPRATGRGTEDPEEQQSKPPAHDVRAWALSPARAQAMAREAHRNAKGLSFGPHMGPLTTFSAPTWALSGPGLGPLWAPHLLFDQPCHPPSTNCVIHFIYVLVACAKCLYIA